MKINILLGFIAAFLFGGGVYFLVSPRFVVAPVETAPAQTIQEGIFDGRNITFVLDGRPVTLVEGLSEVPAAPGSSSKVTTRYFGNEAKGDLDGDGREDVAFLVVQESGGSGVFYYVVVALHVAEGYKTTNAFLIGDRIAPQTTEIQSDARELRVNFAERNAGEPMTSQPSVGATLYLKVTPPDILEGLMK